MTPCVTCGAIDCSHLVRVIPPNVEAIQYQDWAPWHAVLNGGDLTVCGRNAVTAFRMWGNWSEKVHRCQVCSRIMETVDA